MHPQTCESLSIRSHPSCTPAVWVGSSTQVVGNLGRMHRSLHKAGATGQKEVVPVTLPAGENPNFFFSIEQLISTRAPCRSCSVSTLINQCDAIEAARALCDLCPMCHLSESHRSTIISGQCWTLLRSRSSSCRGSIEGSDDSYHVQTCSLHWFLNLISG
jgi:hypothetical protein